MEPAIKEKAWNPEIEERIRREWEESGAHALPEAESYYTIDTPPPYPSGAVPGISAPPPTMPR